MKRPEGFDPGSRQPASSKRPPARAGGPARPPAAKPEAPRPRLPKPSAPAAKPHARPAETTQAKASAAERARASAKQAKVASPKQPRAPREPRASREPRAPRARAPRTTNPEAIARAEQRRAARERRAAEKAEIRRFTRRARHRRAVLATLAGLVVVLIGLVLVAVYSPILALRTITVEGTSRIDPAQVQEAVSGQLGTPLALVDFQRLTTELGAFPLIRSYVTETVPPDTLIIRIVEREPVGVVLRGGSFELVDPAGVTIASSPERPAGVPFIDLGTAAVDSPGFRAVVAVLLALPPSLLAQVDSIAATTQDDVTLVLTGVGQRVQWGDAANSEQKARVLENLIRVTDPSRAGEFDVSAPGSAVFSPAPPPPAPPSDGGEQPAA